MPLIAQMPKPRIILGMMTFGPDPAHGARITTQEETKEVLDLLQARGYNEIDTARVYINKQQEAWTREAAWKERGLKLATKVLYPGTPGLYKREKVFESVDGSLKELGTDCVDILYLHAADRSVPFAETLEAMNELHQAGKFIQLGLSNYTAFEVAEIVMMCKYNGWVRPTIYQGMYNAITRSLDKELIPACRRYGLDLVVYNPLAGGLFSGKIKSEDLVPKDGRFSDVSSTGKQYRKRYFRDSTFQSLKIVEEASEKSGISMIEIALRWTVHHSQLKVLDGNDGVIVGVSSAKQLGENLDALEKGPLPDDVVEALDEAWAISKGDTANYWHLDLEYTYNTQEALFGPGAK